MYVRYERVLARVCHVPVVMCSSYLLVGGCEVRRRVKGWERRAICWWVGVR